MTDRFEFAWKVPEDLGWRQATTVGRDVKHTGPALVSATLADPAMRCKLSVSPETNPLLFRTFAEITPNKEEILAFATHYGNLGEGVELAVARPRESRSPVTSVGVFLDTWQAQIAAMRRLTELWDLIQQGDEELLAHHICWRYMDNPEGPSVYFDSHPEPAGEQTAFLGDVPVRELIACLGSDAGLLEKFPPGEAVRPAKAYLQAKLDQHLRQAADNVTVGMAWDPRRGHPVAAYRCPTLLSAVWLQFGTVVCENLTYGRCRECGKWFEVAPNASRASRRFCSTACRSKAYRERQDRARQMFTIGKMTFEQIAEELDSDLATVKRWVTGQKG